MKRKILITAGILVLLAILSSLIGTDNIALLIILPIIGLVWLMAYISLPLWLIDWLVFKVWLGRKSNKYKRFYELSTLWLTLSYKLPRKMSERGAKYGWLGIVLMLVSPVAIATYCATVFWGLAVCVIFPLSEKDVPYKTHKELVVITGLQDFPAFTYSHNKIDFWSGDVMIYYDFNQELSSAYTKKLEALCDDPDNYIWRKNEKDEYELQRGFDGKYIKSPIKNTQIELTIRQDGFVIRKKSGCFLNIEDFGERDSLNLNTGVTFPKYEVVNYYGEGLDEYYTKYYLLLDKKPSKHFIKQLEESPKWTKSADGTYCCQWVNGQYSESITIDKNSRMMKAECESLW